MRNDYNFAANNPAILPVSPLADSLGLAPLPALYRLLMAGVLTRTWC
jgi:hypothetical protein